MAARVPTRLTRGDARRFGLVVGTAFVLLGAVSRARGGAVAGPVGTAIGAALVLAGVVAPGALAPVHRGWMAASARIASVTTPILMGVVYFGVITPIGVVRRIIVRRSRPAGRASPRAPAGWVARDDRAGHPSDMEHQF